MPGEIISNCKPGNNKIINTLTIDGILKHACAVLQGMIINGLLIAAVLVSRYQGLM